MKTQDHSTDTVAITETLPEKSLPTTVKVEVTLRSRRLKKALEDLGWNTDSSVWRCKTKNCGSRVYMYTPFCCMCGKKMPKTPGDSKLVYRELEKALKYALKEKDE